MYMIGQYYNCKNSKLQITEYDNDIVIAFKSIPVKNQIFDSDGTSRNSSPIVSNNEASFRGEITSFSRDSSRRLKLLLRNLNTDLCNMITLTYPADFFSDGRLCKRHLNVFLQWLRDQYNAKYVWVQEFQERGALHFHIVVDVWIHKLKIREEWAHIVSGNSNSYVHTRIESLRSTVVSYFSSYIRKSSQKTVPESFIGVGRFWGASRGLKNKPRVITAKADYNTMARVTRTLRKWYANSLKNLTRIAKNGDVKNIGFKWRFKINRGFTAWGGNKSMVENITNNLLKEGINYAIH